MPESRRLAARRAAARRRQRLRGLLVVSEIAIAMILLVGAGLLVRSFQRLQQIDPGFRPENVLVLPIFLDQNAYDSGGKTRNYYRRLIEKLLTIPGVVDVGGATVLPGSPLGPDFDRPVWKEGDSPLPGEQSRADVRMVTTEYFRTLGIPVVRGRPFSGRDGPRDPRVVVINESLARRTWPGEDPIGRRLVIDYSTSGTYPYEVIGVVADLRFYGLRSQPRPEVYLPHAQRSYLIMNIAVRTDGDPARQVAGLRRAVLEIDPDQPAHSILPLKKLVGASIGRERFAMQILGGFAITALLLSGIGIYGVLSFLVRQRNFEIGIRMALGAGRIDILAMILRQGAVFLSLGVALGLAGSLALTRFLSSLLFEVGASDPLTIVAVSLLLTGCGLLACYLPARKATRVDLVHSLRCE